MKNTLIEVRKEAEKAVEGMPDGDLKTKAFETILAHLLGSRGNDGASPVPASPATLKSEKAVAAAKRPPTTLADRILLLKTEGFFSSQRSIDDIRQELRKNGWHHPVTSMSGPLQGLVSKRELRRERISDEKGKGWRYSNW